MNFVQSRFTDVVFKGFYSTQNTTSTQVSDQGDTLMQHEGGGIHHSSDEEMKDEYDFESSHVPIPTGNSSVQPSQSQHYNLPNSSQSQQ
jgi:hypothetical protein